MATNKPNKQTKNAKRTKVNKRARRIPRIDRIRTAYIMYKDIPIATISEESCSLSGDFDWVIKPIYENWKICMDKYEEYVSIAGIDETLHKEEYIRRYVPYFVTQRTIPDGRGDLYEELEKIGLTYNDLFEFMCRTHSACGNDDYYVSRTPDKVIDVDTMLDDWEYDIPPKSFDASAYGRLDKPIYTGEEY